MTDCTQPKEAGCQGGAMDPKFKSTGLEEGCCVFCDLPKKPEESYGKFLHHPESGIHAHYYCMLFACGLSQRGEASEGLEGFLINDILVERKRAQRLKCKYCKKKGASVGCSVKACHQIYHFGCGCEENAIFLFYDSFVSYCVKHRPVQKVLPSACSPSHGTCPICMEGVSTSPGHTVLKTPCCKGTWLHRECVQMQALSAGYFFRCAICNNESDFQDEMKKFGIYIPEKDADWERDTNAYQELYERHNQCDVDSCRCPKGRKYCTQSGQWAVVLCDLCGSAGCHVACGGLVNTLDDWACKDCTSTFTRGFNEQSEATQRRVGKKPTSAVSSGWKRSSNKGGTRACSAIRSQGKHPRPPPTTPRHIKKKRKPVSSPVCPPLSPINTSLSAASETTRSTPRFSMSFPELSLSPTHNGDDVRPGSSRGSFSGSSRRESLPQLDCYVALEMPKIPCHDLNMPSLSPAPGSGRKRKSSSKLRCKKSRKLDMDQCDQEDHVTTALYRMSRQDQKTLSVGEGAEYCLGEAENGDGSPSKQGWGSRLLESFGSLLPWRRPRSAESGSSSREKSSANVCDGSISHDAQPGDGARSMADTNLPSCSNPRYTSSPAQPQEQHLSVSPVPLSEEMKLRILSVTPEKVPSKTRNLLHDLTSWKDDCTWKEAKQELAHLFQVDGRATRSAIKKRHPEILTPNRSSINLSKAKVCHPLFDHDNQQAKTYREHGSRNGEVSSSRQGYEHYVKHGHSSDHKLASKTHEQLNGGGSGEVQEPVQLSAEQKAAICPFQSGKRFWGMKNELKAITSWKDDKTWKEAKGELASLFESDERITRTALRTVASGQKQNDPSTGRKNCTAKQHSTLHMKRQNLKITETDRRRSKAGLKMPMKRKHTALNSLKKGTFISPPSHQKYEKQHGEELSLNEESGLKATPPAPSLQKAHISSTDSKACQDDHYAAFTTQTAESSSEGTIVGAYKTQPEDLPPETPGALEIAEGKKSNCKKTTKGMKYKTNVEKLTSWKADETWKGLQEDLALLLQVEGRTVRSALKRSDDGSPSISSPRFITPSKVTRDASRGFDSEGKKLMRSAVRVPTGCKNAHEKVTRSATKAQRNSMTSSKKLSPRKRLNCSVVPSLLTAGEPNFRSLSASREGVAEQFSLFHGDDSPKRLDWSGVTDRSSTSKKQEVGRSASGQTGSRRKIELADDRCQAICLKRAAMRKRRRYKGQRMRKRYKKSVSSALSHKQTCDYSMATSVSQESNITDALTSNVETKLDSQVDCTSTTQRDGDISAHDSCMGDVQANLAITDHTNKKEADASRVQTLSKPTSPSVQRSKPRVRSTQATLLQVWRSTGSWREGSRTTGRLTARQLSREMKKTGHRIRTSGQSAATDQSKPGDKWKRKYHRSQAKNPRSYQIQRLPKQQRPRGLQTSEESDTSGSLSQPEENQSSKASKKNHNDICPGIENDTGLGSPLQPSSSTSSQSSANTSIDSKLTSVRKRRVIRRGKHKRKRSAGGSVDLMGRAPDGTFQQGNRYWVLRLKSLGPKAGCNGVSKPHEGGTEPCSQVHEDPTDVLNDSCRPQATEKEEFNKDLSPTGKTTCPRAVPSPKKRSGQVSIEGKSTQTEAKLMEAVESKETHVYMAPTSDHPAVDCVVVPGQELTRHVGAQTSHSTQSQGQESIENGQHPDFLQQGLRTNSDLAIQTDRAFTEIEGHLSCSEALISEEFDKNNGTAVGMAMDESKEEIGVQTYYHGKPIVADQNGPSVAAEQHSHGAAVLKGKSLHKIDIQHASTGQKHKQQAWFRIKPKK